ncbi:MAG TPA: hypothetical protein VFG04_08910 [Planctomycetaceae bacterium]|jgi:hypothetical protein|nr:hypothetical protein [Planctomycetaceae bacterium]
MATVASPTSMESIITDYEPPARFDEFGEPLPIQSKHLEEQRAETRARYRTICLLKAHGFESAHRQFVRDVELVGRRLKTLVANFRRWDPDEILDRRQQINASIDKNRHNLIELAAAAELLARERQDAVAS